MLQNTFIHLPSIGYQKEKSLWNSGIKTWDDFLDQFRSDDSKQNYISELFKSKSALHEQDPFYFSRCLRSSELWRTWPEFKGNTVFLDIETTGLSPRYNEVTVVGLYDGKKEKCFIQGKNLEFINEELERYKSVITFNGALFDIPFLQASLDSVFIPPLHIDLRFLLNSLGYWGGLKKIEKDLGLERESEISNLSGKDAVKLWRRYKKGDHDALDLLVKYNIADIKNLKILMEFAYGKKKTKSGFTDKQ